MTREEVIDRLNACADLEDRLEAIRNQVPPDDADRDRWKSAMSLDAVLTLLNDIGVDPVLRKPLLDLLGALADADEGRNNPLFRLKHDPNALKRGLEERQLMAHAAGVVTLFIRRKKPKGEAVRKVAARLGIASNTLENYREKLTRNALSEEERQVYDQFVSAGSKENPELLLARMGALSLKKPLQG